MFTLLSSLTKENLKSIKKLIAMEQQAYTNITYIGTVLRKPTAIGSMVIIIQNCYTYSISLSFDICFYEQKTITIHSLCEITISFFGLLKMLAIVVSTAKKIQRTQRTKMNAIQIKQYESN